jgi:uncharacterized membrane protein
LLINRRFYSIQEKPSLKHKKGILSLTVLCALSVAAVAQSATFEKLPSPTGPTWSNFAVSRDGQTMAANYGGELYRWTAKGGFVDLGAGDWRSSSVGISNDGSTIISSRIDSEGNGVPSIWKEATGWTDLGHPANGCTMDNEWGSGYDISGNGSVAVGLAWYCPGAEGFQWTQKGGMKSLGHPVGASSRASAISADGKTVVGFFEDPKQGFRRPVRWIAGKSDLFAGRHTPGEATGISSDGSRIVGQAGNNKGVYAFYYSQQSGLVSLGTISGNATDQSFANAVANNGLTVGWSGDMFGAGIKAFIWGPHFKMMSLRNYLKAHGAKIPANIFLTTALDISADGSTIVGTWQDAKFNQGGWIAHLKPATSSHN